MVCTLAAMNSSVMNIFVQLFCLYKQFFNKFQYIFRTKIDLSYANSTFNLLKNHQTVFHSNYRILHSHQFVHFLATLGIYIFRYPHPSGCEVVSHFSFDFLFSIFFSTILILVVMRWYHIVALICSSLISNDIEHHFLYLLAT